MNSSTTMANRSRVFLDVSIGEEPAGRLTIELFNDKTPRTCEKCVATNRSASEK